MEKREEKRLNMQLRDVSALSFSFKNILRIDNLQGLSSLVKLQLDNNVIDKICNLEHLVGLCTSRRSSRPCRLDPAQSRCRPTWCGWIFLSTTFQRSRAWRGLPSSRTSRSTTTGSSRSTASTR